MVGKPKPGLWTPPLRLSKGVLFSLAHDFGIIVPGAFSPVLAKHSNPNRIHWPYGRFNTANLSSGLSVGRSTQGPVDRPSFLFSFDLSLPGEPQQHRLGRLPTLAVGSHEKLLQSQL